MTLHLLPPPQSFYPIHQYGRGRSSSLGKMHQFDSFREVRVMKGAGIEFRSPWMIRIGNVEIDRTNKQVEYIGILVIYIV